MTAAELVRREVRESSWSQARLGRELGLTPSSMLDRLKAKNGMTCGFASRALGLLGWELVAVPRGCRLPNGAVRIDG